MRKKKSMTYASRYRYKLNMLEPGICMMKCSGALVLIGFVLELLGCRLPAMVMFWLAGAVFFVLLALVAVELHQDKVLNGLAVAEQKNEENRERRNIP